MFGREQSAGFCVSCGKPLFPGDAFCTECGTPVPVDESIPSDSGMQATAPILGLQCPKCRKPLDPDCDFCIYCGTKITSDGDSGQVSRQIDYASLVCPACNAPVDSDDDFCIVCGQMLRGPADAPAPVPPPSLTSDPAPFSTPAPKLASDPVPMPGPKTVSPSKMTNQGITDEFGNVIDDDPLMVSQLVEITAEEARQGCVKQFQSDTGETLEVVVPPNANAGTQVDIPGHGLRDPRTGAQGVLRVSFLILRS